MTNFEIAMLLVLIGYGIIFGIVCAGLFSRTRRNKSGIEITNKILGYHKLRIDEIDKRIDFLVQIIGDQFEELKADKAESEETIKGKWIVKGQDIYCSKCGGQSAYNCWGASKFSDFCPNCGAKMVESQESEDKG